MGRPYRGEMTRLAETFTWAARVDLKVLRESIRIASVSPLQAIGSGGSLTCAHALASLHQRYTGHPATVATPLEATEGAVRKTVSTWLLSAGGGNVDILGAARALILREPRQLSVLCSHELSPLGRLCKKHPFVDLLAYAPPPGKDGFLATNSLLGFSALLTRAYAEEHGAEDDWRDAVGCLELLLPDTAAVLNEWKAATEKLWTRPTTLVLHGPSTQLGAIDLESKFTEAAVGHVQLADYRNFAHGRHHWLAKRGSTSSVLALVSEEDAGLAERTLKCIPADIPRARIRFEGGPSAVGLGSLLAAFRITEWVAAQQGIDPGRPGVPEFGRKLYHLRPSRRRRVPNTYRLTPRDAAAVARKAGLPPVRLAALGQLEGWQDALFDFRERLAATRFAGIVLDYDGTVVDPRRRSHPPERPVAAQLERLAEAGTSLAVASGRGKSLRLDLQRCLPQALWPRIVVGYYNGAEIASLDDDTAPDGGQDTCAMLQSLTEEFRRRLAPFPRVKQVNRRFQITLAACGGMSPSRLWEIAQEAIFIAGTEGVTAKCSDHSVDILAPGISKEKIVSRLRSHVGDEPILTVGDQGQWQGNDYELLREPFSLGVNRLSLDPSTCWHLGEPGQRGPTVTLEYLSALRTENGSFRFMAGSLE